MQSQAQTFGEPPLRSWDDYERGCLSTFGGGHHDDGHYAAFRHGMQTVFNLLRAEFPSAELCQSAPALLDACKSIVAQFSDVWRDPADRKAIDSAVAAIAAAEEKL